MTCTNVLEPDIWANKNYRSNKKVKLFYFDLLQFDEEFIGNPGLRISNDRDQTDAVNLFRSEW